MLDWRLGKGILNGQKVLHPEQIINKLRKAEGAF